MFCLLVSEVGKVRMVLQGFCLRVVYFWSCSVFLLTLAILWDLAESHFLLENVAQMNGKLLTDGV